MSRKKTDAEFKKEVKILVGEEYTFLDTYVNAMTKLKVRHEKCGRTYEVKPNSFLTNGNRCPLCWDRKLWSQERFVEEVKKQVGNEYTVLGKYLGANDKVKMRHEKCGYEYLVKPSTFLRLGTRCVGCLKTYSPATEEFNIRVFSIVGDEYQFLGEYVNSTTKMEVFHKRCGRTYSTTPSMFINAGVRCRNCYISGGEAEIEKSLIKRNVRYVREKTFKSLGRYRFDFYLLDYDYCIEFDGDQHYKPVEHWGGVTNYQKIKESDSIKEEFCEYREIGLLRIPWTNQKHIDLIIERLLKNLESNTHEFLEFIDWSKEMEKI